jgi:hypothetical protein
MPRVTAEEKMLERTSKRPPAAISAFEDSLKVFKSMSACQNYSAFEFAPQSEISQRRRSERYNIDEK